MLEEYYGNVGNVGLRVSNIRRYLGELSYRGFDWIDFSPSMLRQKVLRHVNRNRHFCHTQTISRINYLEVSSHIFFVTACVY